MIGCEDGSMLAYDVNQQELVEYGVKKWSASG